MQMQSDAMSWLIWANISGFWLHLIVQCRLLSVHLSLYASTILTFCTSQLDWKQNLNYNGKCSLATRERIKNNKYTPKRIQLNGNTLNVKNDNRFGIV